MEKKKWEDMTPKEKRVSWELYMVELEALVEKHKKENEELLKRVQEREKKGGTN